MLCKMLKYINPYLPNTKAKYKTFIFALWTGYVSIYTSGQNNYFDETSLHWQSETQAVNYATTHGI